MSLYLNIEPDEWIPNQYFMPECISSQKSGMMKKASVKQIKLWRKLSQKKYRSEYNLFFAEGERCVEQILQNGKIGIEALLVSDPNKVDSGFAGRFSAYRVSEDEMNSITDTENPQGVAAVCKIPAEPAPEQLADVSGIIVATDGIQDPGNLGTIIRTASWFGAKALLAGSGTVDPWNSKVVRSAAGAIGTVPVVSGNLVELLPHFEKTGWQVYLLESGTSSNDIRSVEKQKKSILVTGNEANGISNALFKNSRQKIKISGRRFSGVESLNAAIALSIALFHFFETD